MAHSSTRDIIDPYIPAYTTRQVRRNHAAIGGVVPGCVLAGIRKMHDVRYATPCTPTPCTLPLQGCQQLTDRSLHESYIQPNTQNAREICRIGILRVSRAFNTGQAVSCVSCRTARRGASHLCDVVRCGNGSGISQHDSLPSASIAAYRRTSQAAATHSAVCSCAPSRAKSAMR